MSQAWHGQANYQILACDFHQGLAFLKAWHAWLADTKRPRQLHYVALCATPCQRQELLQAAAPFPELIPLAQALSLQWRGLLSGFHRISLNQAAVLLTLCVGETRALLREQRFSADCVLLDLRRPAPADSLWDIWRVKALSLCCRHDTVLALWGGSSELKQLLAGQGFQLDSGPDRNSHPAWSEAPDRVYHYRPHWPLKTSRRSDRFAKIELGSCAVIGAGLAGASVAAALAKRGWRVQILDQAASPAAGASSLPVGLFFPHTSVDDSPRSRLSRSGVRLLIEQARLLLQPGLDWDCTGVLEHSLGRPAGRLKAGSQSGEEWTRLANGMLSGQPWAAGMAEDVATLWHSQGGWLKPARLIEAWLSQAGVSFVGGTQVAHLQRDQGQWSILDPRGQELTRCDQVVLANGLGAQEILHSLDEDAAGPELQLEKLPSLQAVRGQISWALQRDAAALPPFPVNGLGSLIPNIPWQGELAWFFGASYEAEQSVTINEADHHQMNRQKLTTLLPAAATALNVRFNDENAANPLQAWSQTRCVSPDRLPLLGPLQASQHPSLWISAAMGSRGLSFCVLCAELLAARLGAEPWPIEASLARSLLATRR